MSFVVCPRILASWSEGVLDTREIRTREEGEVIDPEKEIDPPEEEAAVEATADLPLLLALAGMSLPPLLCAERPSQGRCFGARRETVRDKMTRLALTAKGAITYYGRGGAASRRWVVRRAILTGCCVQVCKGATGGNRRPWDFPKISLRWGAGASAGCALYSGIPQSVPPRGGQIFC